MMAIICMRCLTVFPLSDLTLSTWPGPNIARMGTPRKTARNCPARARSAWCRYKLTSFHLKNSSYLGSKLTVIYTEMLEDQTEPVEVDVEEVVVLLHHLVPVPDGEVPGGGGEDQVGEVGDGAECCWRLEMEERGLELTVRRGSELERTLPERAVTHGL